MTGLSGSYRNETASNSTRPRSSGRTSGSCGSGDCSSASRISKIRSAEATPDCSRFTIVPIWVSGWLNWREYWMKACTSPSESCPVATRRPPTSATSTKLTFPRNMIEGMIRPEMNCALKLDS
ncbi:Uncharacterised protein [Mycobacteroides abscessus subsp. abscessus]|nr:Uncharacterised protein [Mycobacteroides abscessus subsp. abscessus]